VLGRCASPRCSRRAVRRVRSTAVRLRPRRPRRPGRHDVRGRTALVGTAAAAPAAFFDADRGRRPLRAHPLQQDGSPAPGAARRRSGRPPPAPGAALLARSLRCLQRQLMTPMTATATCGVWQQCRRRTLNVARRRRRASVRRRRRSRPRRRRRRVWPTVGNTGQTRGTPPRGRVRSISAPPAPRCMRPAMLCWMQQPCSWPVTQTKVLSY